MILAIAHRETKLQDTSASPTNDLDLLGFEKDHEGPDECLVRVQELAR